MKQDWNLKLRTLKVYVQSGVVEFIPTRRVKTKPTASGCPWNDMTYPLAMSLGGWYRFQLCDIRTMVTTRPERCAASSSRLHMRVPIINMLRPCDLCRTGCKCNRTFQQATPHLSTIWFPGSVATSLSMQIKTSTTMWPSGPRR